MTQEDTPPRVTTSAPLSVLLHCRSVQCDAGCQVKANYINLYLASTCAWRCRAIRISWKPFLSGPAKSETRIPNHQQNELTVQVVNC